MQEVQGFIVLLDISGYTRYVRAHNLRHVPVMGKRLQTMGEAHAEAVVTDLLETLITATSDILRPEKLEGDAVLLTAIVDDPDAFSKTLLARLQYVFQAFHKRLNEIIFCETCLCDCCTQMHKLRVKAIAHHGPFLLKKVAGFREIAGQEVIRAHRLLKNEVQSNEYLLLTDAIVSRLGEHRGLEMQSHTESDKDLGETRVWVHFPEDHSLTQMPSEDGYFTRLGKMQKYFAAPRDRDALMPAAK